MGSKANAFRLQYRLAGAGEEGWRDVLGSNHADVLMRIARRTDMPGVEQRIVIHETGRVLVPPGRLTRSNGGSI